jgi:hypothetical protein
MDLKFGMLSQNICGCGSQKFQLNRRLKNFRPKNKSQVQNTEKIDHLRKI